MAVRRAGLKLLARILGALAGVGAVFVALPCCGFMPGHRTQNTTPPLNLFHSSITPSGRIRVGDTICAMAQTTGAESEGYPIIYYTLDRGREDRRYRLYDDGTHGDDIPNDGVWILKMVWDGDCGTGKNIQVRLALVSKHGYSLQPGATVTLDVEPAPQRASFWRKLWPW